MPTDPEPTPLPPNLALSLAGFLVLGATAALTVLPQLADAARELAEPTRVQAVSAPATPAAPKPAAAADPTAAMGPEHHRAMSHLSAFDGKFRECFEEARLVDPELSGSWTLEVPVTVFGEVRGEDVRIDGPANERLTTCLRDTLKLADFGIQSKPLVLERSLTFP